MTPCYIVDMSSPGLPSRREVGVVTLVSLSFGVAAVFIGVLIPTFPVPLIPVDLSVYIQGSLAAFEGPDLYEQSFPTRAGQLPFTYPPFAAIFFLPLSVLPTVFAVVLMIALSVAALILVLTLGAIRLTAAYPRALGSSLPPLTQAMLVLPVVLATEPVWRTLCYGQVNLLLTALILVDLWGPRWPGRGVLIGVAAAVKLTPAVLVLALLAEGDRRSSLRAIIGGVGATLLAAVALPHASVDYWFSALHNVDRIGRSDHPAQQSVRGVIDRLALSPAAGRILWVLVLLLVFGLVMMALWRMAPRQGHPCSARTRLWAPLLCGLLSLMASPISWSHHWIWLVLIGLVLLALRRWGYALIITIVLVGRWHFLGGFVGGLTVSSPALESEALATVSWLLQADYVLCALAICGIVAARGVPETSRAARPVSPGVGVLHLRDNRCPPPETP